MTTSTEQRLREALGARAEAVHADPDAWDRLLRVIEPPLQARRDARHGRRPFLALAVTGSMALLLLVVSVVLGGGRGGDNVASPGGGPVGAAPDEFVAILSGGDIVRVDASTGEVRNLVTPSEEDPASPLRETLDITPDRQTVFFGTYSPECGGGVFRVPAEGGTPTLVAAHASDPAVSPDGRLLAFLEGTDEFNCSLVVMDLSSGERRTYAHPVPAKPASGPGTPGSHSSPCPVLPPRPGARPFLGDISYYSGINSLSWSRDSRHLSVLAFEASASPLRPPEYIGRAYVLDTAAPGGLENMRLVGPLDDAASTAYWTGVQWQDARSLLVIGSHRCGPEEAKRSEQTAGTLSEKLELLLIDTATGRAKAVASFERKRKDKPYRIEAAASGHVLWVSGHGTVATLRNGKAATLAESTATRKFLVAAW